MDKLAETLRIAWGREIDLGLDGKWEREAFVLVFKMEVIKFCLYASAIDSA